MSDQSVATPPRPVAFRSYPKLLCVWPLVVAGPLLALGASMGVSGSVLGWAWLWIAAVVIVTLGVQVGPRQGVGWLVAVAVCWALGMWLKDANQFTLFGDVYDAMAGLDVKLSRGAAIALSSLLAVPFAVTLIGARVRPSWRLRGTTLERRRWRLRTAEPALEPVQRVTTAYPDLLEMLLCGAGTLILHGDENAEPVRIPHVPLLPLVRRRIRRQLAAAAITAAPATSAENVSAVTRA